MLTFLFWWLIAMSVLWLIMAGKEAGERKEQKRDYTFKGKAK